MHKTIAIICNKEWEFGAFTDALNSSIINQDSRLKNKNVKNKTLNRETICINMKYIDVKIEMFCLQDYIKKDYFETNSKQKFKVLNKIFKNDFDLTISIGTGTSNYSDICNGSVLIGGHTCIYNPYKNKSKNNLILNDDCINIIKSSTIERLKIDDEKCELILNNILQCPNVGGKRKCFKVSKSIVGLSVINIINFDDYSWADFDAINVFNEYNKNLEELSLDTTHGLVRLVTNKEFLFINGITNRLGKYKMDFEPSFYTQGYVAAYNCGTVFNHLLQYLVELI